MTFASVSAIRAARKTDVEWEYTLSSVGGTTFTFATTGVSSVGSASGMAPSSLAGVGALDSAGLITRVQSDLRRASNNPNWHYLFDLIWVGPDVSMTTAGTTTINSLPFPARDLDGSSNGRGFILASHSNFGLGWTASYTNSSGISGRTSTSPVVLTGALSFQVLPLQAGDEGIQSVQSVTVTTTNTNQTVRLLLLRPIGRYLAGPLVPGERVPAPLAVLTAGTVLLNGTQPASSTPPVFVRADIALEG